MAENEIATTLTEPQRHHMVSPKPATRRRLAKELFPSVATEPPLDKEEEVVVEENDEQQQMTGEFSSALLVVFSIWSLKWF